MPLLPPTYIGSLDPTNPVGTDSRTISDDYHRMIQESCRMTLPNLTGAVNSTHQDLNLLAGLQAAGQKPLTGQGGVTTILFVGASPPTGYTAVNYTGSMLVTAGTIGGGTVVGGQTGGTDDPGVNNKVPSHTHPASVSDPGHTHPPSTSANTTGGSDTGTGTGGGWVTGRGFGVDGSAVTGVSVSVAANGGASNWTPKYLAVVAGRLNA